MITTLTVAWWLTGDERMSQVPEAPAPEGGAMAPATSPPERVAAGDTGAEACATCHPRETELWRESQHARAMAAGTAESVLGDFDDARFEHLGVTSTFFRRDGRYFVRTDGPGGTEGEFEITHTFGVEPLQQVLIEMPGGRLQALGIAWDSRPADAGGQRWFHLYPERALEAGDPLHWTGIDQTWNYQCADCHSTHLRKGYDEATRTYRTTSTDPAVGCEACHGPGGDHVAWARKEGEWREFEETKGLTVALDERRGVAWAIDPASGSAVRSRPRDSSREIDTCARCHARRGQLRDDWHAGRPLADAFRPALLSPGLYHPDGQQLEEVYTWGSFLQSRMHARGVTCADCHEPHSGKLRAEGNAACALCHAPSRFDTTAHTHHSEGSSGAACVACHMPAATYMIVDPRRDHSFRIPRPDLSAAIGVPNACNQCHADQSAEWAAAAIASWSPEPAAGFQTFAAAFHAADTGAPGAQRALAAVAGDPQQPPIVRASAVERLARYLGPATLPVLRQALGDRDDLVRASAAVTAAELPPPLRAQILAPLLGDPVRLVRIEAARALAGEAEAGLAPADRQQFARALDDLVAAERFHADRPEAHTALGAVDVARGQAAAAEAAYRTALDIDPTYVPAALELADLQRVLGREADAERTLRAVLERVPESAAAQHALGLALVRQQRRAEALAALARAAALAPEAPRFAHVYAVALHDSGDRAAAMRQLEAALARHPYDRDVLLALATFERDAGNVAAAREHAELLRRLEPESPEIDRLARSLGAPPP